MINNISWPKLYASEVLTCSNSLSDCYSVTKRMRENTKLADGSGLRPGFVL